MKVLYLEQKFRSRECIIFRHNLKSVNSEFQYKKILRRILIQNLSQKIWCKHIVLLVYHVGCKQFEFDYEKKVEKSNYREITEKRN